MFEMYTMDNFQELLDIFLDVPDMYISDELYGLIRNINENLHEVPLTHVYIVDVIIRDIIRAYNDALYKRN